MPFTMEIVALVVAAALLGAGAGLLLARARQSPEKREQSRRLMVNRHGRLVDGVIVEATASTLFYTYSVAGVGYHASQDISRLGAFLPEDPSKLVGPVWLKYSRRNPANSIVVCEKWSGLRSLKETQPR